MQGLQARGNQGPAVRVIAGAGLSTDGLLEKSEVLERAREAVRVQHEKHAKHMTPGQIAAQHEALSKKDE